VNARHIAHTEKIKNAYKISVIKPDGKNHLGDKDIDKRII
jgi:hypothetical protein